MDQRDTKEFWFLRDLARSVEDLRRRLACAMTSLSERLAREARRLEEEGADATFNSLGEVQGHGSDIDRLCGELARVREIYSRASVTFPEAAEAAAASLEASLTPKGGRA